MPKLLALVAAFLFGAQCLVAQDSGALPDARLAGTWKLDRSASDSVPSVLRTAVVTGAPAPSATSGRTTVVTTQTTTLDGVQVGTRGTVVALPPGSARPMTGAPVGVVAGPPDGPPSGAPSAAQPRSADYAQVARFMADLAPTTMVIRVESSQTMISADDDSAVTWVTDKKKRPDSQSMLGAMESSWWLKALQTIRTIDNGNVVQRDMKVSSDGKTLEVKVTAKVNGKKTDLKEKYTKVQ